MKYLVVNADDFGYTAGVNEGIIRAHREGIVTSASLMVDGDAAEEAVALSRDCPDLAVGLHFQMTDEGLVSLIRAHGKLYLSSQATVEREFGRQIEAFERLMGRKPSHIDSHHSIHLHSQLVNIILEYADEHDLAVRGQNGNKFIRDFFAWDKLKNTDLSKVSIESLKRVVAGLEDGVNELMCHPGVADEALLAETKYAKEREVELQTLTEAGLKEYVESLEIELVSWEEVGRLVGRP